VAKQQRRVQLAAQKQFQELIGQIRKLQEVILQERDGQPLNVDAILEELREERDGEALGLR
jgi:hypothetical protein